MFWAVVFCGVFMQRFEYFYFLFLIKFGEVGFLRWFQGFCGVFVGVWVLKGAFGRYTKLGRY